MESQQPLNWQASATVTNVQTSSSLPAEVESCLKNARFLHLGTCDESVPHVSLMNYTYLPATPFYPNPVIIMTTNPSSKKTSNLIKNPRVSLLVHDWVSHRPPTRNPDPSRSGSPPSQAARSSLANLLLNLNTSALSSISATIDGEAKIVTPDTEEDQWYKKVHLENNTFGHDAEAARGLFGSSPGSTKPENHDGSSCFIQGEEVRVILVEIRRGRIADWKGGVQDWTLDAQATTAETKAMPSQPDNGAVT